MLPSPRLGEIARQNVNAFAEIGCEPIEDFAPGAGNADGRALRVKRARDAAADGAGRPGDQRRLPGELEHGLLSAVLVREKS